MFPFQRNFSFAVAVHSPNDKHLSTGTSAVSMVKHLTTNFCKTRDCVAVCAPLLTYNASDHAADLHIYFVSISNSVHYRFSVIQPRHTVHERIALNNAQPHRCTTHRYVRMGFTTLRTALIFCAKSQDSLPSVPVRRAHVVFSTAGFMGRGKPCPQTRETAAPLRGIQKASRT